MTKPEYYVSRIKAKTKNTTDPHKFGKRDWREHISKLVGLLKKHEQTGMAWTERRRLWEYDHIFINNLNRFFSQEQKYFSISDYIAHKTLEKKKTFNNS